MLSTPGKVSLTSGKDNSISLSSEPPFSAKGSSYELCDAKPCFQAPPIRKYTDQEVTSDTEIHHPLRTGSRLFQFHWWCGPLTRRNAAIAKAAGVRFGGKGTGVSGVAGLTAASITAASSRDWPKVGVDDFLAATVDVIDGTEQDAGAGRVYGAGLRVYRRYP
ncbi:MAG: hypothetical protein R3E95_12755 [Thiolinea sp.]